jgi:hypothetical protein
MASDEPVRWGILGTGNINRKLVAGARQSPRSEIVAVGSRTIERARAHAAELAIPRAHGSYGDLLADPDVEAVYISLPNSLHHPSRPANTSCARSRTPAARPRWTRRSTSPSVPAST